MLSALADAGLGPQEVEHLWACYEKAKAAEDKAGFNTGQHASTAHPMHPLSLFAHVFCSTVIAPASRPFWLPGMTAMAVVW
jgi:hypothetical protein